MNMSRMPEWKVPTPWSAPYDAVAGRNDHEWLRLGNTK